MSKVNDIIDALQLTLDITNTTFAEPTVAWLLGELQKEKPAYVLHALERCRREVRGPLSAKDIFDRIPRLAL
jgi:hypothetical protein